ncbi:DUF5655 domain-containing protein [Marimonas arenosa]|uniref:DUF5655 domain-containing protein n=1 Tax=Marimonas arenosa TaxID=1795305 RepID=A0AAE3WGA7_9RHOB|nr:DUF5655 domain-containing protein [Marimonas arenosa]MDQ2091150.1 DUF5655 domain-containing protein [Marimonas arenosa]
MDLYSISKGKLEHVEHEGFPLERDIQQLVEANLEELFGLHFVSSEFAIDSFRIDTLCFDEESKSFVIIEYKKGSSYSVIDQGYSYLSVMLNNKADFILEYNERQDTTLRRDQVDWSASRVIFISPAFNSYQKNSVNFRDVPFELWEIRKFKGGLVSLERYQSSSKESIEKLSGTDSNSVISKVSSEVRVYKEEDHVAKTSERCAEAWNSLRERLEELPDVSFYARKGYVAARRDNTVICFVHFHKNHLNLDVLRGGKSADGEPSKGFFTLEDPKGAAVEKNWTYKNGSTGHSYNIHLKSPKDIDYTLFLLKQKYEAI